MGKGPFLEGGRRTTQLMRDSLESAKPTMRRKALQGSANTLCDMFCGWRLTFSFPHLERLGSGALTIDLRLETAFFEGRPTEVLPIVGELRAWLDRELRALRVPWQAVRTAQLRADLTQARIHESQRALPQQYMDETERPIKQDAYISCDIRCAAVIETDERSYSHEHRAVVEWPAAWHLDWLVAD